MLFSFLVLLQAGANDEIHHENNGKFSMPNIGLGTAGLQANTQSAVIQSLDYGVRLIDTAQAQEWYNEYEVGQAISRYETDNNLSPEDILIVTKVHPRSFGYEAMDQKLAESRQLLNRSSLDVVLLHSPDCWPGHCTKEEQAVTWQSGWRHLEQLRDKHNIRAIGVSNFDVDRLEELVRSLANSKVTVVQNWMDPFHQDREVRAFAAAHRIHYMAYSSFGTQWGGNRRFENYNPVLTTDRRYTANAVLRDIAESHHISVAEVVISWAVQLGGLSIIPRSASAAHLHDNFRHLQEQREQPVTLSAAEMAAIEALDGSIGLPWDN